MRSTPLKYSKTKIDKAEEVLKNRTSTASEIANALDILSSWRAYHAMPLDTFATVLGNALRKLMKVPLLRKD